MSADIQSSGNSIKENAETKKRDRRVLPEFQHQIRAKEQEKSAGVLDQGNRFHTAADAWYSTYGTHVSRVLAQQSAAEYVTEAVIGDDDRVRIRNTNEYPYSAICSLEIVARTGRQFVGTGFLVDSNTVVTAGHCLFMPDQGGWAKQIRVYPGRNGAGEAQAFAAINMHSVEGWTKDRRPQQDYGAITLDADATGFGSLGYVTLSDREIVKQDYHVVGYSADKPIGTLWGHLRELAQVRQHILIYETDTYGGNSGCPVFCLGDNDEVFTVGIHNYGDISGNSATRITDEVFENISRWSQ
ncbi:trypsin-like serine peptidase [Roseimaritima multifibrata]|uniref:trypsin-like serine peptidase n=1 Tax=Roseimaritima multifibrata TaxID=1930274 RepID=UPI001C54CF36|nr:trypsin-like serine protease [Roseimaritima multifibrata]